MSAQHPRFPVVVADVRACFSRLGLDVDHVPVSEADLEGCIGVCDLYVNGAVKIKIKRGLRGCRLWRVIAHEFGHALGLGHTQRGIMAPKSYARADFQVKLPTEAQKRRWTAEIARLVMANRLKNWTSEAA